MKAIKCGFREFELKFGDQIMDNGSCLQLVSRKIGFGHHSQHPKVSKKEFARFKNIDGVIVSNHEKYKLYTLANEEYK